jgi:hypothetical protein
MGLSVRPCFSGLLDIMLLDRPTLNPFLLRHECSGGSDPIRRIVDIRDLR